MGGRRARPMPARFLMRQVPSASIDCRPFLDGAEGYVLSVGTDSVGESGWDANAATVTMAGPVPSGSATSSLFDSRAACSGVDVNSLSG
jgi:hypothetical protein